MYVCMFACTTSADPSSSSESKATTCSRMYVLCVVLVS